jgi:phenylpropionate dioxygenase-like ring-hydroxylating dioxygenase large terminal subunit
MLSATDNTILTETGPTTPMGRVFRSYWQPALLSRELEADGSPVRIRIMGEDFVAFRDTSGEVGVLEPRCSHRGANLFLGRNEDCGLRCVYHGWKFDHQGNCVDIPTSRPEVSERLKPKAKIRALPVREWGDLIWVYLDDTPPPELPEFEFASLPPEHRFVSKKFQQCNWAQAVEGGLDTAHFSYLHANIANGKKASLVPGDGINEPPAIARFRWLIEDGMPRFTILGHDAGMILGAARTADNEETYWRLTQFLMPNHSLAPNTFPGEMYQGNSWVPVDDTSCWIYCFAWNPDRPLTDTERAHYARGHGIFAAVDENFVPIRNRDNDYLIDRSAQRHSNFTGIEGISEQDAAIADSQGPIADRSRELLGQTDLGIVRFRQLLLQAAEDLGNGLRPKGSDQASAYRVRSGDAMAATDTRLPDVLEQRFGSLAGQSLQPLG